MPKSKFSSIDSIIKSAKKGQIYILVDDENRENEGDLIMASQFIKASDINFMASKGRGLICLTLTESKCKDLDLPLLKRSGSESSKETNFTSERLENRSNIPSSNQTSASMERSSSSFWWTMIDHQIT